MISIPKPSVNFIHAHDLNIFLVLFRSVASGFNSQRLPNVQARANNETMRDTARKNGREKVDPSGRYIVIAAERRTDARIRNPQILRKKRAISLKSFVFALSIAPTSTLAAPISPLVPIPPMAYLLLAECL